MRRIIVSIIILITAPSFLQAAVFQVSTIAELEAALSTARDNEDNDTINIAAGTYTLTSSLSYDTQVPAPLVPENYAIILQGTGGEVILNGGNINHRILFMRTNRSNEHITIKNIIFKNAYAPEGDNGAGLFIKISSGNLTLENVQILDCHAAAFYFTNHGGGAYITAGSGNVILRNCVVSGNQAKGLGGGLYLSLISGTLSFINNTIINNTNDTSVVEGGGGVYLLLYHDIAQAHLYNNILWGNSYKHGDGDLYIEDNGDFNFNGSLIAATVNMSNNDYNQLDYNLGTALTLSDNISQDPLLSADFHLAEDSPCLDQGTSTAPDMPARDFEGDPRSHDGNRDGKKLPDMGADEFYNPPASVIAPILLLQLQ